MSSSGWVLVGMAGVADNYGPPTLVVGLHPLTGASTVDLPHPIAEATVRPRVEVVRWFWGVVAWDEVYAPGVMPVLGRVEGGELVALSGWNLVGFGEETARRAAERLGIAFEPQGFDPFAVPCKRCGEVAPNLCRDSAGGLLGHPHEERAETARAEWVALEGGQTDGA